MFNPLDYPRIIFMLSLPAFWVSEWAGASFRKRQRSLDDPGHHDFEFILGAALTLLGLIIAFTFSMAVNRYDQRKNFEEQEANAIGTEYVRADLLNQQVLLNFAKAADLQNIPSAEIDSAYAADLKKILSLAEAAGKTKEALIPKQQALALLRQVKWGPYRPELLEFFIHQSRVLEMIPEKGAFLVAVWRIDHFARS